jgi:23S rRNA (uracil1939-C5)-methyltransferase
VSTPARTVRIEKLAPTGEGVVRGPDGVGFVDGALPGELVATTLYDVRKKFWRGSLRAVLEPSADRVGGPHADCAGCDWAYFSAEPARRAKRELFLETMRRIGRLEASAFEPLAISASPGEYRMRVRLHADGGRVGYHAPGSHRVVDASACDALGPAIRSGLPAIEAAIRESGAAVSEVEILESRDGSRRLARATASGPVASAARLGAALAPGFDGVSVRSSDGASLLERGEPSLPIAVGLRTFAVSAGAFFQSNRFLVGELFDDVAEEARGIAAGEALDAFGGVGLFAGALLDAGHTVQSVEADGAAARDAGRTRASWADGARWEIAASPLAAFLEADDREFECVVADPPRAGLGTALAADLARRARRRLLYVSCDPATLARDLPAIFAEGFRIRRARLYDFFAFTHRVEALVSLERAA